MGWAASRAAMAGGHSSALTHRSISIVGEGGLEVCDGAYRLDVMKKVKGTAQAKFGRSALHEHFREGKLVEARFEGSL